MTKPGGFSAYNTNPSGLFEFWWLNNGDLRRISDLNER